MQSSSAFPEIDYKAIVESSGTMIIACDLNGIVRLFNPAAERLLGWKASEVVGHHTPALWPDPELVADRAKNLSRELGRTVLPGFELFATLAKQGKSEHLEWTYIRRDGSRFPVQLLISPIRNVAGELIGYVGSAQDLTARAQAEQERDRIYELSLDMIGIADQTGYFRRTNPAFTKTLGWRADELQRRPFMEFVHPDDWEITENEMRKLASGVPTIHFENRYQCRDGSWKWLAWTSSPQPDGKIYAIARDVTERRAAEERIRENEQNLTILLNSIGDAVLSTDSKRRITSMNPVAEQMTGWTDAEARGRPIDDVFVIINEETRRPAHIPVDDVLATGAVHALANHTILISRDGTECAISDSAAPIRDRNGWIKGVVLVF